MSVLSTSANYGGRVVDNQQGVKQFYVSGTNTASWIYKRLSSGILTITPSNPKTPVMVDNDLVVTKDLYVNGSIYNPSDRQLKENITTITDEDIDKIMVLNPLHFNYKNDANKLKTYGFLAQDVEILYPELTNTENGLYKTVNYIGLIPILTAKMQKMQMQIDKLNEYILNEHIK